MTVVKRCSWVGQDELLVDYHDHQWGHAPVTDVDWFEMLVLETFQAGLSWRTVLHKRAEMRVALAGFDWRVLADWGPGQLTELLRNPGLIRNRRKLESVFFNARRAKDLSVQYGSLNAYFMYVLPGSSDPLQQLQDDFAQVGRTTAESFMFATGLMAPVHDPECFLSGFSVLH